VTDIRELLVQWLGSVLQDIPVHLQIKHSPRVPGGINRLCNGIEDVLRSYRWRSAWFDAAGSQYLSEDWATTKESLRLLRLWLQSSLASTSSDHDFATACYATIAWGGGTRSGNTGAKAFVDARRSEGRLQVYFQHARQHLSIVNDREICGIEAMNAMLIKIHSLLATDGLPIYDSRVAGSAGALVELFFRSHRLSGPLLDTITFPSTSDGRSIKRLLSDSTTASTIRYAQSDTALRWATASVNLGRLFHDVLTAQPKLFLDAGCMSERMHALEASLFMMGANLRSLKPAIEKYNGLAHMKQHWKGNH
jgi:hypothetical protein